MGDDLKPCPFCGVSNTYIESGLLDGRYSEEKWFQVQCQECCAVGSSRSAECAAVEAWNNAGSARAKAAEAAEQRAEALAAEVAQARAEGAAAIARADLAEFKLRRFLPTESGRRCGSIPPCAGCCRDSSGAKCATPRKAQEAKAAEVETWAGLYSRAKVAEAEAARLRAAIAAAVDMLPEWSTGALSHLSPAERAGDAARRALLATQGASLTPGPA